MQIHTDPCTNHPGSERSSGNLRRQWLEDHKTVTCHHTVVPKVTSSTEGWDAATRCSPTSFEVSFLCSWESLFCMHHSTLALSVLSPPILCMTELIFFSPELFLILSSSTLAVSAVCVIRPSCYSLTRVLSQYDSLSPPCSPCPLLGYTSGPRQWLE